MYTNHGNISLPIAVWLAANNGYDLVPGPNVISATTLLKPIRSIVLSIKVIEESIASSTDISDLIPARLGTAVHTAAEVAWDSYETAMEAMGIPQHIIDNVRVNPPHPADPETINIYIEQRNEKSVMGYTISGKYDFVMNGRVTDLKTTGTYNWIHGGNDLKYSQQGSIYRWLNPEIITDAFMDVEYLFTDWSGFKAMADKKYPQHRSMTRTLKLMSMADTQIFIEQKLIEINKYRTSPQQELPKCTEEELWQKPTIYAYYKKATALTRSTKNFESLDEANLRCTEDGSGGVVITRPGEVKFCRYCNARPICLQAEKYIQEGLLKL